MKKNTIFSLMAVVFAVLVMALPALAGTGLNYMQPASPAFNPTGSTNKATTYTILSTDSQINNDTTSAGYTVTLPTIASLRSGGFGKKSYKIVKTDATTNILTVAPATGDTIGGGATRRLLSDDAYMIISTGNGNDWIVDYETPYLNENHVAGTYTTGIGSGGLYSATSGSGTVTLTASDCGNVYSQGTGTTTYALPSTVANCTFTFINGVGGVYAGMQVDPATADQIFGGFTLASSVVTISDTAGDSINNSNATCVKGDFVKLVGDGADGWFIVGGQGIWAED
jgi:hypothetical protein